MNFFQQQDLMDPKINLDLLVKYKTCQEELFEYLQPFQHDLLLKSTLLLNISTSDKTLHLIIIGVPQYYRIGKIFHPQTRLGL